jgi:hypothetical protein
MQTPQKKRLLQILAIAIPVVGLLYLISRAIAPKQYALIVTHSGPGTLDIADGTHPYPSPTQVVINAYPEAGYQANWNLNGVDVEQGVNQYSIYVNGVYSVAVSFVLIGPPPSVPTGIRAIGTISTLQNFRFWYGNPFATIDIAECDENWNDGKCAAQKMRFKVHDAAGRGVPNMQVAVYPEINPDGTPCKGIALFNDAQYSVDDPLILTTDAEGLVSFDVRTIYGADDIYKDGGGIELSRGTGLGVKRCCGVPPVMTCGNVVPVWHGWGAGLGCWIDANFGGGTIVYNRIIRADLLGTDKYALQSYTVNFGVKWKA